MGSSASLKPDQSGYNLGKSSYGNGYGNSYGGGYGSKYGSSYGSKYGGGYGDYDYGDWYGKGFKDYDFGDAYPRGYKNYDLKPKFADYDRYNYNPRNQDLYDSYRGYPSGLILYSFL